MIIDIYCYGHDYTRDIENILHLFFEEVEAVFHINETEKREEQELQAPLLRIEITGQDPVQADVQYRLPDGSIYTFTRESEADTADAIEWRKSAKRAMNYALLNVLQQHTGIVQPWGILTGIRPTKLLHMMLEQGKSLGESHQVLREERLVTEEKIALIQSIVDRQLQVIPDLHELNRKEVSIYLGIPFCPTKCAYCTFPAYSIQGQQGSVAEFLEGLHYEIQETGRWLKQAGLGVTTVYFGGGTPTSITAEQMDAVFAEMYASFPGMESVRELTVEAGRPDTITPDKIEVMKKWKTDRISINPQSFTQETLDIIGRHHTVEETVEKYHMARDLGLSNINMDLIIGLPGETSEQLEDSLHNVEELMPASLTVHTLSFKRASAMTKNKEKYKVAGREEIGHMMDIARRWTAGHGYVPYYLYRQKNILGNLENVGYSLPGQESLYNIIIMEEKQTIIGLGCGAVSKLIEPGTNKITRFPNPKEPRSYIETYRKLVGEKINVLNELYGLTNAGQPSNI
jgi:oxygen-independent coproporphyrinogen III oxidase